MIGRSQIWGHYWIGPEYLDVGRHFNGPLREAVKKAAEEASRAIPCNPVRAELAKFWKRYSVHLPTEGLPTLFFNAWPEAAGSSGILSEDNGIRIVLMLSGKATVETSPGEETPLGNLPAHVKLEAQPGQLNLAVPFRVEYAKLMEALNTTLSSKVFQQSTPAGRVSLRLHDFELFPSEKHVAVGVKFQADAPTGIFDAKGTVWLLARPTIGADSKTVQLTDIGVYRKTDNEAFRVITAILEGQISKAIANASRYDLREDEQTLIASLQTAISDPAKTGGARLTVKNPSLRFARVAVEEDAILIEGLFNAEWNAEVQELKL